MYVLVTIMALSLLRHAGKLKKMHHFIVVEWGCVNELVGGIVNFAQIPKNVAQVFVEYPLTPLPLMTYSQNQGKCIADYLQWAQDTSSPLWRLWLWCICIHGNIIWGMFCLSWCYSHSIVWCTSSSLRSAREAHSHSLVDDNAPIRKMAKCSRISK